MPRMAVEQRGRTLMMELREGRNRQIRRMMDALGRTVVDLCRVGVGQWTLDGLGSAEWRELGAAEIDPMRVALGLAPRGAAPRHSAWWPRRAPRARRRATRRR